MLAVIASVSTVLVHEMVYCLILKRHRMVENCSIYLVRRTLMIAVAATGAAVAYNA